MSAVSILLCSGSCARLRFADRWGLLDPTVNALQTPPALHIACTRLTVPVVGDLLRDLREAVDEVKAMDSPGGGSMVMLCAYNFGFSSREARADSGLNQTDSARAVRSDPVSSSKWRRVVSDLVLLVLWRSLISAHLADMDVVSFRPCSSYEALSLTPFSPALRLAPLSYLATLYSQSFLAALDAH